MRHYYNVANAQQKHVHSVVCLCQGSLIDLSQAMQPMTHQMWRDPSFQPTIAMSQARGIPCMVTNPSKTSLSRKIVYKTFIGHTCLANCASMGDKIPSYLIEVSISSNPLYEIPLYLLHQGVGIVGEKLQASRLTFIKITGNSPLILPPERMRKAVEEVLPFHQSDILGVSSKMIQHVPFFAHRVQVPVVRPKGTRVHVIRHTSPLPTLFQLATNLFHLQPNEDSKQLEMSL